MSAPARRSWLRVGLFAAAAGFAVLGFVLFASAPRPEAVAAAGEAATAPRVTSLEVAPQPLARRARIAGVVEARRRVELFSETHGRVVAIGADELDLVDTGQTLVSVDPTLAQVAVERAEAALARAESRLHLAQRELDRWQSLARRDAASAARHDDAVNAHRVALADQREARANLIEARDQIAKKTIAAPFAGVLQSFPVEVGEYLRNGQEVARLLDLSTARIVVGVSDREVVALERGAAVGVELEAFPGRAFRGRVSRIGRAADPHNKKFPVEVEVPNADTTLLPGMIARVTIEVAAPEPVALIPQDAAVDRYGLLYVYVLEPRDDGLWVARQRRVELRDVPFRPAELEVLGGLEPGERIATSGVRGLRDGVAVRLAAGAASS